MISAVKSWLLRVLRIPAEPDAPAGVPESVRVFRAAPNYYKLKLITWAVSQVAAFIGLLAAVPVLWSMDLREALGPFALLELAAVAVFIIQLPLTYMMVRFDYEMRWYIVTDRSLRIRYGIQKVREMTMTFANIQQITVRQGPLQRLLGIADLQVRTAGGGDGTSGRGSGSHGISMDTMHVGYFRGVENAHEIRDLMLARLRHWRDAGLGDPDDVSVAGHEQPDKHDDGVLEAAQRVLMEARGLRQALEPSGQSAAPFP